jgi:glycine/D-amino acid oxidase-like deaminating enzyme
VPPVLRSAHGFWLADAGPVTPRAALESDVSADVAVIGGGYLGLWTAWFLAEAGADVVVLESGVCGHGPSGRNGGFVNPLWDRIGELRALFGDAGALAVARASATALDGIEAWCREQGVDAHLVRAPMLEVATAEGQEGSWRDAVDACREIGAAGEVQEVDRAAARSVCDARGFGSGVLWCDSATVHPALLALGLRARLLERGVRVFERTRATGVEDRPDGVRVRTAAGSVQAAHAVLAVNHATAGVRPLRGALSVASSHVVATEPVPDVLEGLGWTGGEGIADCRTMLHYTRTTRDGRIVFGWGGGRMGYDARRRRELDVDEAVQDTTARQLLEFFPQLRGRRIEHAWGGPIDVSPVHLPWFGTLRRTHYGFGFTGNGVGPAHLGGRILADLASDARTALTALPIVGGRPPRSFPPEPLRFAGGSVIRAALVRADEAAAHGRRPDPVTRAVAGVPRLLGLHLPR